MTSLSTVNEPQCCQRQRYHLCCLYNASGQRTVELTLVLESILFLNIGRDLRHVAHCHDSAGTHLDLHLDRKVVEQILNLVERACMPTKRGQTTQLHAVRLVALVPMPLIRQNF